MEIDERIGTRGEAVRSLDKAVRVAHCKCAYDEGICACVIVLMHAYRHPEHERKLGTMNNFTFGNGAARDAPRAEALVNRPTRGNPGKW